MHPHNVQMLKYRLDNQEWGANNARWSVTNWQTSYWNATPFKSPQMRVLKLRFTIRIFPQIKNNDEKSNI